MVDSRRQAGTQNETKEEIEITSAMQRAGARVIEDLFDVVDGNGAAARVFSEMWIARRTE